MGAQKVKALRQCGELAEEGSKDRKMKMAVGGTTLCFIRIVFVKVGRNGIEVRTRDGKHTIR